MAEVFSPQVIVNERDISNIAPAVSTSIVALVGGATKGPLNEPTFVSTPSQFVEIFGEPTPLTFGPYAAINFLRQGNQLWYVRVASVEGNDPISTATTDQPAIYTSTNITSLPLSGSITIAVDSTSVAVVFNASNSGSLQSIADTISAALRIPGQERLGYARVNGDRVEIVTQKRGPLATIAITASSVAEFPTGSAVGSKTVFTAEALTPARLVSRVATSGTIDTSVTYATATGSWEAPPYDVGYNATKAYSIIQVDAAPNSGEALQFVDQPAGFPNFTTTPGSIRVYGSGLSQAPSTLFSIGDSIDVKDAGSVTIAQGVVDYVQDYSATSGIVYVRITTSWSGGDVTDVAAIVNTSVTPTVTMGSTYVDSAWVLVAGTDFSITGSTTDIAQSIAQAINVKIAPYLSAEFTNNQVKVYAPNTGSTGNVINVAQLADGPTHLQSITNISVVDGNDNSDGTYSFKHGFDAASTKTLSVTVDGVLTSIDFEAADSSVIPNPREATAEQIANYINQRVGVDVAFLEYDSGTGQYRLSIISPTPGIDGSVEVVPNAAMLGATSLFPNVTPAVYGTGDNRLKFEVDNTYVVEVFLTQSATLSLSQAAAEINAAASAVHSSLANVAKVEGDALVLESPTKGSKADFGSSIILHSDLDYALGPGPDPLFNVATPYEVEGTGAKKAALTIAAATPGSWANDDLEVVFTDEDDQFATPNSTKVDVYYRGALVESFREVVIDPTSDQFVETVINGNSEYITIDFDEDAFDLDPNTLSTSVKILSGRYSLEGGGDGLEELGDEEVIGVDKDPVTGRPTGLRAYADTEQIFINIIAAPGHTSQNVGDALVALAEERGDTLAILDPPFGLTAIEVIDWHNGLGNGRTNAINSSYAALYDNWLLQYDPYNDIDVWMPPSVHLLAQFAFNDRVAEPWFATAGLNRGKLAYAKDVYYKNTLGERELMFQGTNRVNPIVRFTGEGIFVWGNQTLYRKESPLRDITVRRLLNFAKAIVSTAARQFLFEPNNETSRQRLIETINPVFDEIRRKRGLITFRVVDNTTDRDVNLRRARITVFLQPTRSIDVIQIDFGVVESGGAFVL